MSANRSRPLWISASEKFRARKSSTSFRLNRTLGRANMRAPCTAYNITSWYARMKGSSGSSSEAPQIAYSSGSFRTWTIGIRPHGFSLDSPARRSRTSAGARLSASRVRASLRIVSTR